MSLSTCYRQSSEIFPGLFLQTLRDINCWGIYFAKELQTNCKETRGRKIKATRKREIGEVGGNRKVWARTQEKR